MKYLVTAVLVAVVLSIFIERTVEKVAFNKGICKCCGHKMELTARKDYQGSRIWICPQCSRVLYVSYNVDKKYR